MSIAVVFALIAFAGVFLFFLGISQMRRAAGGTEDFQARLAAYGVTTGAGIRSSESTRAPAVTRLFAHWSDCCAYAPASRATPSKVSRVAVN